MKTLYLLRHADALFSNDQPDIDRILSPQGLEDAKQLGEIMDKKGYKPDFIHCSTSKRTNMTLDALNIEGVRTTQSDKLYLGTAGDYIQALQETGNQYHDVMLIGHNPSIHESVRFLAQYAEDVRLMSYRPCTLTVLKANIPDWLELNSAGCAVEDIISF